MLSEFPSELRREIAKLLRGLPRGEAMGEGMRCTSVSYLVFNAWLSSCRDLTNFEVNPKPVCIVTSVSDRSLGWKPMMIVVTRHEA